LEVGQTWKEGGAELKLKEIGLAPNQLLCVFEFTNRKSDQITVKFVRANNFFASSNNKPKLDTCYSNYGCDDDRSYVIPPGETVRIESTNREQLPAVNVDTTNPELTEIIVKVTGFSTITDAQWRVPITH
jgi:hypothetical protein